MKTATGSTADGLSAETPVTGLPERYADGIMAIKIKYPKNETSWVLRSDSKGNPRFLITSKAARDWYFMYEVQGDGTLKKLGKARTPTELEDKYCV